MSTTQLPPGGAMQQQLAAIAALRAKLAAARREQRRWLAELRSQMAGLRASWYLLGLHAINRDTWNGGDGLADT